MSAFLAPATPAPDASRSRVWLEIGKETLAESQRDDVPSLAAGVAFRIFLSLFPSLIAGVAILNLVITPAEVEALVANLAGVVPDAVVDIVVEVVGADRQGVGGALAIGVLGGVWAASSAAVALMKALSRARSAAETRGFVTLRALGLVITAALFAAIAVLLVLLVFGPQIQNALLPPIAGGALRAGASVGRYLGAVLVLQVLFAFVYWIGPDRSSRPPWRWLSPGAVLGVVGWLLASYGFSLYTRFFGTYVGNPAYAGFGAVIVVLLWLHITMLLLLVGAELNFIIERRRGARRTVEEGAGFGVLDPLAAIGQADLEPPEPVGAHQPVDPPDRSAPSPAPPPEDTRGLLAVGLAVAGVVAVAVAVALRRRTD